MEKRYFLVTTILCLHATDKQNISFTYAGYKNLRVSSMATKSVAYDQNTYYIKVDADVRCQAQYFSKYAMVVWPNPATDVNHINPDAKILEVSVPISLT